MPSSHSLTCTSTGGLLREIRSRCGIAIAFDPRVAAPYPPLFEFEAIWDTGATSSVITQRVVDDCGLSPTGMTRVYGVGGEHLCETYLVNIILPNQVGFPAVRVTKGELTGVEVLIGMDIITRGDFVLTNMGGRTVFTFRYPSQCHMDFTQTNALVDGAIKISEGREKNGLSRSGARKRRNKNPKTFGKNKK